MNSADNLSILSATWMLTSMSISQVDGLDHPLPHFEGLKITNGKSIGSQYIHTNRAAFGSFDI